MSRQARLGLIVLAGILAFVLALFILANRTFLLAETYRIRAEFSRVGGLTPGASVQYQGISVGRVEAVNLPVTPGAPIEVELAIRGSARHLVRQDTRAVIQTDGLVGSMIVVLKGGSTYEPIVAEGGRITGVDPFDFTQVTDRLFESVARFDSLSITFTGIMQDVRRGEGTLGRFLYDPRLYDETVLTARETRAALRGLTAEADALVGIARDASAGINEIILKVNEGEGTLARLINDDAIHNELLLASQSFREAATDIETVTDRAEDAANWGTLAMFRLAENMEALKENWFFKGYYERRGYREKAPFEIRELALEETYEALEQRERELYEWERRLSALEARLEGAPAGTAEPAPPAPAPEPEPDGDAGADAAPGPSDPQGNG